VAGIASQELHGIKANAIWRDVLSEGDEKKAAKSKKRSHKLLKV